MRRVCLFSRFPSLPEARYAGAIFAMGLGTRQLGSDMGAWLVKESGSKPLLPLLLDACIFGPSDPTHPSWPTGADDGRIVDWNPYQGINGTMGDRVAHGGDVSPPDRSIGFGLVVAVVDSPHRLGLGVAGV